jgi:hypothetical protein
MLENTAAVATAEAERTTARVMPIGRRFQPGQCANPGGRPNNGKRFRELRAKLESDFGSDLSPIENVLLDQACGLLIRAERVKDAADAVKCANASARLLATIAAKRKARKPAHIPLREQLAAEAEQAG